MYAYAVGQWWEWNGSTWPASAPPPSSPPASPPASPPPPPPPPSSLDGSTLMAGMHGRLVERAWTWGFRPQTRAGGGPPLLNGPNAGEGFGTPPGTGPKWPNKRPPARPTRG